MVYFDIRIMAQEIHKINVLEMHSSLGFAGGQRNMFTFVKNLNRDIFNVYVASYREGGVYEEKLRELGIDYIVSRENVQEIIDFIQEKNIDILHIHRSGHFVQLEYDIVKGAKEVNPDLVVIEKNVFGKHDDVLYQDVDCSLFQSMMHIHERYLPQANREFDFTRMKVFYNMVDLESFKKYKLSGKEILAYKNKLGITKNDFVVGKIARAHIAKWSDLILDMMPHFIKLVPHVKFVIIGVPKSRIKKIQSSLYRNNIIILDETSNEKEVHAFYQVIDVLAHSSKIGECNGNTINEAMYWKKPVIVNSTPHKDNGQLEQVINMKNGIVANYPHTYARAVEYLYKHPEKRMQMGEAGYNQVLDTNSPTIITRQLEKIFIEKLQEKGQNVDLKVANFYANIRYNPSEQEIKNYILEYKKRLKQEFGNLNVYEKIINILYKPKKMYFRFKDFAEDKLIK